MNVIEMNVIKMNDIEMNIVVNNFIVYRNIRNNIIEKNETKYLISLISIVLERLHLVTLLFHI